jgi:hypothetical protein
MKKPMDFDDGDIWGAMSDESEREFLRMKYSDVKARHALCEDWLAKRKHADKSKMTAEGKPNPHYPRLNLEADTARMNYEVAHMVEMNTQLFNQIDMLTSMLPRLDRIEGAYTHLRQQLDYVTTAYKDSVGKHFEDRKEWRTQMAMRRAGLDPERAEDQLLWARRMDELNARIFNTEKETGDVQGS